MGSNGGGGDDDHQFKCDVASHPPGITAMAAAKWSATAMCPLPMLPLERTFAHMLHMYTLAAGSPELSTQQVVVLVVQRHPL